jgi:hypothetical protein
MAERPILIIPEMSTSEIPPKPSSPSVSSVPCFGSTIQTIAAAFRVSVFDAALAISAMLGNVAGPLSGLRDPFGRRIQPDINLLRLPGSEPQVRPLLDFAIHPVRSGQDIIREQASLMLKTVLNSHAFMSPEVYDGSSSGLLMPEGRWNEQKMRVKEALETAEAGLYVPPLAEHSFSEQPHPEMANTPRRNPRAFHHPSVLLENLDLDDVGDALAEVLNHNGLWFDPQGARLEFV